MNVAAFDSFSVGPFAAYQEYERNLSHFTIGHGGYFSPQRMSQLGLFVNALTKEGQEYLLDGKFELSYQSQHEDSSSYFPLSPDGRFYDANNQSGLSFVLKLLGTCAISDHWQVGGGFVVQKSPKFRDNAAMLYLRWNDKVRSAVVSSEIPEYLLSSAY